MKMTLTLYRELSISACPILRFDCGEAFDTELKVNCGVDISEWEPFALIASAIVRFSSFLGLNAPHNAKLNLANFHCSMK